MSDPDLERKAAACTAGILSNQRRDELVAAAWQVEKLPDAAALARMVQP
jgi:hypothetical protein